MARNAHGPPYAVVVFDCDSTLSTIEGIEELTASDPQIAALTLEAMEGRVPIEEVYGRRLELAGPEAADMERIGALYQSTAIQGAEEVIAALHYLGKSVRIVSGGLLPAVRPFGRHLGVPSEHIHAVDLHFDAAGGYVDYDRQSPLARAGGKLELLRALVPDQDVALVGDGATDLEAREACARFIAFTAVERRPEVVAGADVEVDRADLAALLPHLLSAAEVQQLTTAAGDRFSGLVARIEEGHR